MKKKIITRSGPTPQTGPHDRHAARAAALRDNLKKRKEQARKRAAQDEAVNNDNETDAPQRDNEQKED